MHADVLIRGTSHLAVDYGRFHFHAEVGGDVKVGQLCVYVCVDNRQQVYTDKGEMLKSRYRRKVSLRFRSVSVSWLSV